MCAPDIPHTLKRVRIRIRRLLKWPYKCHATDNTCRYWQYLCVLYNNENSCQRKNLQATTEVINLSGKHELSKQMAYIQPLAIHTSKLIELDMYRKWTSDDKSFHTCQSLTSLSSWFAWMWVFAYTHIANELWSQMTLYPLEEHKNSKNSTQQEG